MRTLATLTALAATLASGSALAAKSEDFGSFLGVYGAAIISDDIDQTNIATKIVFGPNITENLSLEFGIMDMGLMAYDDPDPVFPTAENAAAGTPPTFTNTSNGEVDRDTGDSTTLGTATYTGSDSYQARGVLLNLRYNFTYTETVDFFVKAGASAWIADVEKVSITAYGDGTVDAKRTTGSNETSGVELITGVGIMWTPWDNLAIRSELESTSLDSFHIEPAGFLMIGLGIQYEF
jgi:hypothetical protein